MLTINDLVNEMIMKHQGGEEFFNHLDKSLQDKNFISTLFKKANEDHNYFISISSGSFGLYFSSWANLLGLPNFTVNGGLRKGNKIISLEPFKDQIKQRRFIFFDDSFYKGRTRDAVKEELEKWGGNLISTYVCYDGSKTKNPTVQSLYRYYDNHKEV